MICNLGVVGSNPTRGSKELKFEMGSYQSGQMGLTVTQLSFDFGGSNPSLPTENLRNLISEVFCFMSFRVSDYPMKNRSVKSLISLTPISENTLFLKSTYNTLIYIHIHSVLRFKSKHKNPFFLFISDIFSE